MKTIAANKIFMTEVLVDPENMDLCWDIWKTSANETNGGTTVYYRSGNSLIELQAINSFQQIESAMASQKSVETKLTPYLASDFRRQSFTLVEEVISGGQTLPSCKHLQLRYIEVPRKRYDEYIQWRKKTIFASVKNRPEIEEFRAYHTELSTQPGVMFFSGFSCEEDIYLKGFQSPEYQEIVKQAGNRYITGGEKGLYTKICNNY